MYTSQDCVHNMYTMYTIYTRRASYTYIEVKQRIYNIHTDLEVGLVNRTIVILSMIIYQYLLYYRGYKRC